MNALVNLLHLNTHLVYNNNVQVQTNKPIISQTSVEDFRSWFHILHPILTLEDSFLLWMRLFKKNYETLLGLPNLFIVQEKQCSSCKHVCSLSKSCFFYSHCVLVSCSMCFIASTVSFFICCLQHMEDYSCLGA